MENPLIPPTPSEEEYLRQLEANSDEAMFEAAEPLALFTRWLADARGSEPNDANACALATAGADGAPDVRMVLLKDFDARGFVFYSNLGSAKGRQLAANPRAALLFHWKSLRRQVRVRGATEPVRLADADDYFASRPRLSRIGAWASRQSRPLESRAALEQAVAEHEARFPEDAIPRPPHWSGFRLVPQELEFWCDRPFRLHDRLRFSRDTGGWRKTRLFP
jgi:pyridoxamine 5'-phosphate oxidase